MMGNGVKCWNVYKYPYSLLVLFKSSTGALENKPEYQEQNFKSSVKVEEEMSDILSGPTVGTKTRESLCGPSTHAA